MSLLSLDFYMTIPALIPFRPLPLLSGPHVQTILGSILPVAGEPPSETWFMELDDGDKLALEVSTPSSWTNDQPTVFMVHGLCGSHRSKYLIRMARKIYSRGVRAVRMNLRGCGSGSGLARNIYHSGRSDDVLAALTSVHDTAPTSPLSLVGFSLGGNIVLKLAAELTSRARDILRQVIAVAPPADLLRCSQLLEQPRNRLYNRHFTKLLLKDVKQRHRQYPDLPPITLPRRLTLYEFDDLYTAPRSGFTGAIDYYTSCSSAPLVPRIEIPCTILFAEDDPVIDANVFKNITLPPSVRVERVTHGGHLGYLGVPWSPGGYRWLDRQLLEWLDDVST